eukprot:scaffold196_cov371-Prasinococcus_capsulatus_cf.AAC.1
MDALFAVYTHGTFCAHASSASATPAAHLQTHCGRGPHLFALKHLKANVLRRPQHVLQAQLYAQLILRRVGLRSAAPAAVSGKTTVVTTTRVGEAATYPVVQERTQVDPQAPGAEDVVNHFDVLDDVVGGINKEARSDAVPLRSLAVAAVHLHKVARAHAERRWRPPWIHSVAKPLTGADVRNANLRSMRHCRVRGGGRPRRHTRGALSRTARIWSLSDSTRTRCPGTRSLCGAASHDATRVSRAWQGRPSCPPPGRSGTRPHAKGSARVVRGRTQASDLVGKPAKASPGHDHAGGRRRPPFRSGRAQEAASDLGQDRSVALRALLRPLLAPVANEAAQHAPHLRAHHRRDTIPSGSDDDRRASPSPTPTPGVARPSRGRRGRRRRPAVRAGGCRSLRARRPRAPRPHPAPAPQE